MANQTTKELRGQVMYSVFVRNHTAEGTFRGLEEDLDRIRRLGVDIIWLMPIHPIGKSGRKGSLGSPYAIQDYRSVNREYGNMDDFEHLVAAIHQRGMKCIIDVVYNHTSPDSVLVQEHPEWFYRREDGSFGNKAGEWPDVIDLDYTNLLLWDYQIETLKQWATIVDGFRCDVAPLVPLEFWLRARREVAAVRPECIWLSESVEPIFTIENRARGMVSLSDSEIFQAFDICYEYDVYSWFIGYLLGRNTLEQYAQKLSEQEHIYPDNYVKLRFLENHDNPRAHFLIQEEAALGSWLSFCYFQKGMPLLYAGEEFGAKELPGLFDKDVVCRTPRPDWSPLLQKLYAIKKHPLMIDSRYEVWAARNDVLCATHRKSGRGLFGAFPVGGRPSLIEVPMGEGVYSNLIDGTDITVLRGRISLTDAPVILEYQER